MKLAKIFTTSFVVWSALFLIDFLYELFQINGTENIVTLMGLKIDNQMSAQTITTTFGLTPRMLLSFAIVLIIVLLISIITFKFKANK